MAGAASATEYEVLRRIARGGMGEVFLARQTGIEGFSRNVVIKKIHANYADDPEFVKMFLQEARIAALLDHPNIVQIFELGKKDRSYFIVMEYVEGLSLSRLLRASDHPLPIAVAIQITNGVAAGLQFAHNKQDRGHPLNLVHRDVSPPNVLLSTSGSVKLTDFGIAKVRWSVTQTQAGIVKGKYFYISPEQAVGAPVDRRADIYSLGLVLYEMTTGRRAHHADNDKEALRAVANSVIAPPTDVVKSYPQDLERVVMRALSRDPEQRYSECSELQEELTRIQVSRSELITPSKLGQFVAQVQSHEAELAAEQKTAPVDQTAPTVKPGQEETAPTARTDEQTAERTAETLFEMQTLMLDQASDTDATDAPTALIRSSADGSDETAETLLAPTHPGEDDEATKLDTRLPTPAESVAPVVEEGTAPAERPIRPGVVWVIALIVLVGVAVGTGILTWMIVRPSARPKEAVVKAPSAPSPEGAAVRAPDGPTLDHAVGKGTLDGAMHVRLRVAPDLRIARPKNRHVRRPTPNNRAPNTRKHPSPRLVGGVTLSLTTDPRTEVFLGRRRLGKTPLSTRVPAGKFSLRFRQRKLGLDTTRSLAPTGTSLAVRYRFKKGQLVFDLPAGTMVKLDGRLLGRTPRPPIQVYEGRHRLVVVTSRGKRVRRTLEVEAGGRLVVRGD